MKDQQTFFSYTRVLIVVNYETTLHNQRFIKGKQIFKLLVLLVPNPYKAVFNTDSVLCRLFKKNHNKLTWIKILLTLQSSLPGSMSDPSALAGLLYQHSVFVQTDDMDA